MSENTFEPKADSSVEGLRNELQALRAVVSFALVLMFVFSICVNIFLFRQATTLGGQVANAQNMVSAFESAGGGAQVVDIWNKLNDYARTHPDFQPVINKYKPFFDAHMKKK
jgi:Ni,Fe-hydrogenase I cytochrome b subunit